LEPYKALTDLLQGTKYVTVSMIIPAVCGLMERADPSTDFILDDGEYIMPLVAITEARELMFADLQHRWFEQMSVRKLEDLSVCTLLDARFKNLELY
jgi:hypothetical protein